MTVRAGLTSAAHVFVANAQTSIASILANGTIAAGDLILVTATTADTNLTLGAGAAGITIAGQDGVVFAHGIAMNGATGVTIRNLDISGRFGDQHRAGQIRRKYLPLHGDAKSGNGVADARQPFAGNQYRSHRRQCIAGRHPRNSFAGSTTAMAINTNFSGLISANDIAASKYRHGLRCRSRAVGQPHPRRAGRRCGLGRGPERMFGAFAGSGSNDIFQNTTGVVLTKAQIVGQHVFAKRSAFPAAAPSAVALPPTSI